MNQRVRDKEVTHERLTEAARALFSERGYSGVNLREIARRAERSTGAVFCCFVDKAHLWREAMGCEPPDDTERGSKALELVRTIAGLTGAEATRRALSFRKLAREILGEAA